MALDQSALLELLAQLKLTDVTDRIRSATETLYQELIDAEATDVSPKYWPLFMRVVGWWASKRAPHATPLPPTFPAGNDRPDARR
jgi:hypothetical protein